MSDSEEQMRSNFLEKVFAASGKAKHLPADVQDSPQKKKKKLQSIKKKALTVRLNPAAIKQFKTVALELGVTHEVAIADALNLFFKKYREPEIA